jgi:hypothetical protein
MRLLIILALLAHGCTDSDGTPCAPDRSGMVPADWVDPAVLAEAEAAGVEVCFLDQQMRRARFNECRPEEPPSILQTDRQQLVRCIDRATVKSWQEPHRRDCLDVMASAPCEDLQYGPCKVGGNFAATCGF